MPRDETLPKLEIVTEIPDKALVIFAHPDDAEIGSGGVVAKWAAAGCEVTYVLCTNGAAGTADRALTPAALTRKRADEQRAAADFMGVRHVVMLGYPDGGLEDTREFLGDIVGAIRRYRPHTVFVHDPYRIRGFQHRDHRKAGITATDAVYPYARDHLHFPEQITRDGLEPHKVRELWYWGADEPDVIVDVTDSIDRQIPGASLIARRQLELQAPQAMPFKGTPIVVCDDDGRRARLAAGTLERMGYRQVSVLDGGINRWVTDGFETEWGMNVPSKDFGEKVEVVHHVPEVECKDLAARIQKGEKFVILDSRTPEEFRRFCIPGGRSVPGGELALRITDIAKDLDKDTTIIVNCAGRTRSIIGARVLQRMGIAKVYGLKNGTAGWVLASHQLETGADRVQLPEPSV